MADRVPIRIEIFERAFKRYQKTPGASFTSLAKKMKVPAANLREWRRIGEVPVEKLTVLADALEVEPNRLMRSPDGGLPGGEPIAKDGRPRRVGHNLLTVARTMRSYTKFLGYHRAHPQFAFNQSVHHPGKDSFYGTLFVEADASRQEFLFSVWFGLRMDYGYVRLTGDMEVQLEPILQEQDPSTCIGFASETEDGRAIISVRTWFGRPSCDFVVQSDKEFSLRWTKDSIQIPGSVTFLKNPFQKDE